MTNQFDINKLNSFIDNANNAISCDAECQRNKTAEELKKQYLESKSNLTLAEPNFELAQKKYYTYISGKSGYDNLMEKQLTTQADLFVTEFKNNYNTEINKINTQLYTYNGLVINVNNIVDLYNKYKRENIALLKELKYDTNDILTNDRKTYYEDQQIDGLNIYYYVLCVIYIIVMICFIIFKFKSPNRMKHIFIFVLFLILFFISTWLLGKIIEIIYWIFNLLPKNVYVSS
jgi:hypothetical protein